MAAMTAVYCDGWDDAVVHPITRSVAEERDAAGEAYSVVLLAEGRPHAVLNIWWAEAFCGVDRYDETGRLISRHEYRHTRDGDLFLRELRTFDGAVRNRTSWELSGRRTQVAEAPGSRHTTTLAGFPPQRVPVPAFGDWQDILPDVRAITDADGHPLPVRPAAGRPWDPPRPLRPRGLDELFTGGAERALGERRVRLSARPAGPLRLPSGRLVAADPSSLDYGEEPFAVPVAPGTYPVTMSIATFTDDPGHERVAAARLDVTDRPAVRWELALRAGQEPLDLGAGEYFGFGVDAGLACFVDEDNRERLIGAWEGLDDLRRPRFTTVADGEMVAWSSGWGDGAYPTWIGRDAAGAVTCFVADMLLFPTGRA